MTMPVLSFCNELLADEGKDLNEQCRILAEIGYGGLEIAPGTLAKAPHLLSSAQAGEMREVCERHTLTITGLHWLLAPYPQLSITDPSKRAEAGEVLRGLIELCATLGGKVLVHGSPGQRAVPPGTDMAALTQEVAEFFRPIADHAAKHCVTYCIECLSRNETVFLNTLEEGADLVERVGSPAFRTMIDTSAAGLTEDTPVAELIRKWVPGGMIGHIQLNDTNRGAPGTGDDPMNDIIAALVDVGWQKPMAVEPFKTVVDASVTAAIAHATVKTLWEVSA
ncbi:MAG: sugar phosphate isomerase/epimerase family protein [Roseibium sp.]